MALQSAVVAPVRTGRSARHARAVRRLAGLARALWGLAVGLLFLLGFPLAILLAPLLWAFQKLGGREADDPE